MLIIFSIVILALCLYLIKWYMNGPMTPLSADMTGKIVIVTGASSGIGLETAKSLLQSGATVIFANRDEHKTNSVISQISSILTEKEKKKAIFMKLDLASFQSVVIFAKEFKKRFKKLDILINNAGGANLEFKRTVDNCETTWQVNHLSPTLLSALLIDHLSKSKDGRIINVSSRLHKLANIDNKFFDFRSIDHNVWNIYNVSKLANIYTTYSLDKYFTDSKVPVKVVALHPGTVSTDIFRVHDKPLYFKMLYYLLIYPLSLVFFKTPEVGAQTALHLCYLDREELVSGGYYQNLALRKVGHNAANDEYKQMSNKSTKDLIMRSSVFEQIRNEEHAVKFLESF